MTSKLIQIACIVASLSTIACQNNKFSQVGLRVEQRQVEQELNEIRVSIRHRPSAKLRTRRNRLNRRLSELRAELKL